MFIHAKNTHYDLPGPISLQAEIDHVMIETATDVVAAFAKSLGPQFSRYLDQLFPPIVTMCQPDRPVSERSTGMATFALITEGMVGYL